MEDIMTITVTIHNCRVSSDAEVTEKLQRVVEEAKVLASIIDVSSDAEVTEKLQRVVEEAKVLASIIGRLPITDSTDEDIMTITVTIHNCSGLHQGSRGSESTCFNNRCLPITDSTDGRYYDYHQAYTTKNGDVTWRCLARTCNAAVKTNAGRDEVLHHDDRHSGPHPATIRTVTLTPSPCRTSVRDSDLPLSPLISQLIIKKDTRNAFTETDSLFLESKDDLVHKLQVLRSAQSSLVDEIQRLTLELERAQEMIAGLTASQSSVGHDDGCLHPLPVTLNSIATQTELPFHPQSSVVHDDGCQHQHPLPVTLNSTATQTELPFHPQSSMVHDDGCQHQHPLPVTLNSTATQTELPFHPQSSVVHDDGCQHQHPLPVTLNSTATQTELPFHPQSSVVHDDGCQHQHPLPVTLNSTATQTELPFHPQSSVVHDDGCQHQHPLPVTLSSTATQTDLPFHPTSVAPVGLRCPVPPPSSGSTLNGAQSMSSRNKNLPKTGNSRVKRTTWLSDEEVWDGIRDLNSDEVLVLSPAECLDIRFLYSQSQPSFITGSNFKLLLAPINNSTLPPKHGSTQNLQSHCNSEGTHWSLIILNRVEGKYVHLDSLRGVNSTCALDFCNSLDKVLSNQNISFEEKKL
ncbi:hypothetical protein J6590_018758 [Homalodisca vitripennis]|nr:hypothetical protein J6590_018758 [Homalodisca vitripennis]